MLYWHYNLLKIINGHFYEGTDCNKSRRVLVFCEKFVRSFREVSTIRTPICIQGLPISLSKKKSRVLFRETRSN